MPAENGLPNFLIIGAAKAGTTSLFRYLRQHPEIFMSPVKEPMFFVHDGDPVRFRGRDQHRDGPITLEAYRELFREVRDEPMVGEASALYLDYPKAPEAIARRIPAVRLIAVLRNPADRAYSSFLFNRRDGREPLADFEAALRAEPQRIADNWSYNFRYRQRGFYHLSLQRYFDRFDPGQIRVYLYEDFVRDPHKMLGDIFRFLEVDAGFRPGLAARHNRSGVPRSARLYRLLAGRHPVKEAAKSVIPEEWGHWVIARLQTPNLRRPRLRHETRADLIDGYREDIVRLQDLIGRDLSHWLR
jgi:hypothetical protein